MKYSLILLMLTLSACGDDMLIPGPAGSPGPIGPSGMPGPVGSPGISIIGPQGISGTNGSSCSVSTVSPSGIAPNGGALVSCTDGSAALVLNGTNGTSGTLITPVQFCPGVSVYPSTFVELGFCINNSIYAVYSQNGGFLTEILPGTWQSNAIGSSCTFTVSPNCIITN